MPAAYFPVSGFPFELKHSRHLPPGAATRHLRMVKQQLCRDAVPTLPKPRQPGQHAVLTLTRFIIGQRVNSLGDQFSRAGSTMTLVALVLFDSIIFSNCLERT